MFVCLVSGCVFACVFDCLSAWCIVMHLVCFVVRLIVHVFWRFHVVCVVVLLFV